MLVCVVHGRLGAGRLVCGQGNVQVLVREKERVRVEQDRVARGRDWFGYGATHFWARKGWVRVGYCRVGRGGYDW